MTSFKLAIHKILNWEYWPMSIVYLPVMPVWVYFAIKARSFFFFNASNPSIKNGGMAMESKKDIYELISAKYIPKTIYFDHDTPFNSVLSKANNNNIYFPFIIKPDIGMKGFGVQIIKDEDELSEYLNRCGDNFLVQEFIKFKQEIGIFYCRIPGEKSGHITGIVFKEFLSVKGDGENTILQLIQQNYRSKLHLSELKKLHGQFLDTILSQGEPFVLVPYGSHTRGCKFMDITERATVELTQIVDNICKGIDGFYYGRLDIMYSTWEELCKGEQFAIIELNGAGSEPTHIYDPSHSIFFAWKEIVKHWHLLYKISTINFSKGHPYLNFNEGRKMLKANSQLEERLRAFYK